MPRDVLENYLQRAATLADAIHSDTLDDDLRMVAEVGAKFLGRAALVWQPVEDEETHFARAAAFARRVHAMDPEIICQACVFEAVYQDCERVPIPDWVFAAFGLAPEQRRFSYAAIVGPVFERIYRWSDHGQAVRGSVPDLTQREAQMWFYYRARRYLEAGYEAIHMGQPHLYGGRDLGYRATREVMERIRALGRQHGRRGLVLLDAHTHGISHRGKTLFDFNSRPFSPLNVPDRVEEVRLVKNGESRGGVSPQGWSCGTLPYLWEIDNYGGYAVPPEHFADLSRRARSGWWGYDDIAWFAHQPAPQRDAFLTYAQRWTEAADPAAFFQAPLRRTLGRATVPLALHGGGQREVNLYKANTPSAACPDGFGQEQALRQVWAASPERHAPQAAPRRYESDPETGLDLPDLVTLIGPLQQALGAWRSDPSGYITRMENLGGGHFEWRGVLPRAEPTEFILAIGGTQTELLRPNGFASGPSARIAPTRENARITVRFEYLRPKLTIEGDVEVSEGACGGQAVIRPA